ncbi:MAG: hypothetical protein ACRYG5_08200 [Janthinobacterium lividum]
MNFSEGMRRLAFALRCLGFIWLGIYIVVGAINIADHFGAIVYLLFGGVGFLFLCALGWIVDGFTAQSGGKAARASLLSSRRLERAP